MINMLKAYCVELKGNNEPMMRDYFMSSSLIKNNQLVITFALTVYAPQDFCGHSYYVLRQTKKREPLFFLA
jgi:hypothetical protein